MDTNDIERAVQLFSRVYKTADDWEEQIRLFIERNRLDVCNDNRSISLNSSSSS
jgi:hypothetical protein